jgi:hypothetical protein
MSTPGYGKQARETRPFVASLKRVEDGISVYDARSSYMKQETISYRDNIAGTPILESEIDPYAWFLQTTAKRKLSQNGENRSVVDVSVGGKVIAYSPHRDNGHAFRTQTCFVHTTAKNGYAFTANLSRQMQGGPYFATAAQVDPAQRPSNRVPLSSSPHVVGKPDYIGHQTDLTAFGQKAIIALSPGFADVSLFASLGELLAGFPKFFGEAIYKEVGKRGNDTVFDGIRAFTKGSAGEFLNVVFGALPTIEDAAEIVESMRTISIRLLQLQADSGHGVRRKMKFTLDAKRESYSPSQLLSQGSVRCSTLISGYGGTQSSATAGVLAVSSISSFVEVSEIRSVSFTGSFTRFLPTAPGLAGSMDRFVQDWDHILGTKPTLERLWQLIPFSWLVDWFLDIKRTLALYERIQDDSLVINYGYVLGTTSRQIKQRSELTYSSSKKSSFKSVTSTYNSFVKERWRCNPYGFVVPKEVELSPLRMGILAAVGLTGGKPN